MDMPSAIRAVTERRDLTSVEMTDVMSMIMSGGATPAQIGGFLIGLRMKGETVDEIAAAAQVMRELAVKVEISGPHLVDTCGTGGDTTHTFNISTASSGPFSIIQAATILSTLLSFTPWASRAFRTCSSDTE